MATLRPQRRVRHRAQDRCCPEERGVVTNRFHLLLESLAGNVARDYREAQDHAREHDPQRAGHEGESTWKRLLENWGPGWPVVTRKYIVGPHGESNEVDVIVLKPDYPAHLHDEPSILISGIAAAFSSKLTLRKSHIAEAIEQKKLLVDIAGDLGGSARDALRGKFPFGLLAHSTAVLNGVEDFNQDMKNMYDQVGHSPGRPLVTHPREELDALLVADTAFFSTSRMSYLPAHPATGSEGPVSSFMGHDSVDLSGAPLAQFITWLNSLCASEPGASSLEALKGMFGADSASGYQTRWPMSVYPEHLREDRRRLLNEFGSPLFW